MNLCALPLAIIGAFVALAVTGRARNLSAVIGLLMLRGILVTTAIGLHEIGAGADVGTALVQSGRTRLRSIRMTATATILALIPLVLSNGVIAASPATVVIIRVRRSLFPFPVHRSPTKR